MQDMFGEEDIDKQDDEYEDCNDDNNPNWMLRMEQRLLQGKRDLGGGLEGKWKRF